MNSKLITSISSDVVGIIFAFSFKAQDRATPERTQLLPAIEVVKDIVDA